MVNTPGNNHAVVLWKIVRMSKMSVLAKKKLNEIYSLRSNIILDTTISFVKPACQSWRFGILDLL